MKTSLRYNLLLLLCLCLFLGHGLPVSAAAVTETDAPTITTAPAPAGTKRPVRVGWNNVKGLQDGNSPETLGGYDYEYLAYISQHANWDCQFVYGTFYELEKKLRLGEIDILGDVAKTAAREKLYLYPQYPAGQSHMILVTRPDNKQLFYNDYAALDGTTIGVSSPFRRQVLEREAAAHNITLQIRDYPTLGDLVTALNTGKVDAIVTSTVNQYRNYKILIEMDPVPFYFVVSPKHPQILYELNTALAKALSVDPYLSERLFRKYFSSTSPAAISLTRAEQQYVTRQQGKHLTVMLARDQKPLAYEENGQVKGLIPAYLKLISQKTGLSFTYIWDNSYAEAEQHFRAGAGALFGQFHDNYSPQMMQGVKKVQPFVQLPYGFITRTGHTDKLELVAVEANDFLLMKRLHEAGLNCKIYAHPSECLDAVVNREVDAAALSGIIFNQLAYHAPYEKLTYKAQGNLTTGLCLGVSETQDQLLYSILSKAVSAVDQSALNNLLYECDNLPPTYTTWDLVYMNRNTLFAMAVLLLVVIFFAFWYRRQKQYNLELETANTQIKHANAARIAFFNNLSHDMRTPLTGVIGYTELALQSKLPGEQENYLHKIGASSQLLLTLINDTLNLAKMENEQFQLSPELVDIHELLHTVTVSLEGQTRKKKQQLTCKFELPEGEHLWVDKLKLQDLLLNLLSNAVKYTPEGGRILFSIQHAYLKFTPYYRIIVQDNGIGISKEFLPHIFESFSQELSPEASGVVGSGLGLSIVKRIVELMKGQINVNSVKGAGTTFTVLLPIDVRSSKTEAAKKTQAEITAQGYTGVNLISIPSLATSNNVPAAAAPKPAVVPDALPGMHLLLCEDNLVNQEIIRKLLQSKGISCRIAANGAQGVETFSKNPPGTFQAILMDIRMPVLDGYGAATAIRKLPRADAATIPIIAMTADAYEEAVHKALACGMNAHLAKPIDSAKLFLTLAQYYHK
jgi:signal transduction histidine kinase/CheY-like chemotaxis protein